MEGIHNLFGHNLVDRIQPLDLLLELGDSILLIISRVLASIFLLASYLVFTSSSFMVLGITPVVRLVGPVLQSLNFLKEPLDGTKIVDQAILGIVEEVETCFTNIFRENQKGQVKELVVVGATVEVPQHLDFSKFSNNAHTGPVHIEIAPGSPLVLSDNLPPLFNHDFYHLLWG